MKKNLKNKSNYSTLFLLLPIVAVVIALPIFLTILVEAPIGSTNPQTETNLTVDEGTVDGSDSPDSTSTGTDSTDINGGANALDYRGGNTDGAELPGTSATDTASTGTDGTDSPSTSETAPGGAQGGATLSSQEELANSWEQAFTLNDVPAYSGELYTVINDNIPFFPKSQDAAESFERYAELDSLGRCGTACANVGKDIMPTEPRGEIGQVRPSGWHTVKYDGIDGNYLYNRCHLIAYQLAGENANVQNLITGTRSFNASGMLPFEEMVGDYVRETDHHVLYRVTPMFRGMNLVADGVLMEAWSVEDNGAGICFNVFVYNVQPGIVIDYATGDSYADTGVSLADGGSANQSGDSADLVVLPSPTVTPTPEPQEIASPNYILNTNTHKFHYPSCDSVQEMAERNKLPYSGTRDEVIAMGYVPCKRCNP
ncbi:MAG: DNA/RNA non-specific endonuclease [Lachnospiraceae bacterium]|nr:DNA/RNA non-specific endonuclease [Lachnospiraceae bacterium]